jgi:hypothetical protein
MSILACSGHLLIDLPIFMGPVLLLVGWLLVMTRKARRQEAEPVRDSVNVKLPQGRLSL